MLSFLKDNSYTIFKMFVNQIGMTMFGIVLSMATYNTKWLYVLTSVFAILFYMFLLYTMSWETGFKEKSAVDGKRAKYIPLKGLYMSLAANVLNILLGLGVLVGYVFYDSASQAPVWAHNLAGTCQTIATFIQGMYLGVVSTYMPENPVAFLLIVIPSLVVCALAYYFGVKGKYILNFVLPGPDKKGKK